MLNTTFALLILTPFILGFMTYGIRKLIQPPAATPDSVTVKLSPEDMQQLREKGYLDPNTGKLKDTVVGLLNLEEVKS
jgi:hypothetical protein